ncbi:ABC transporter substrate-binding protein [Clostridium fallax]|uniref:Peptide/nickel transport system substrate-binding protein n=1 Tax=Clostridium fallax TaxID=1533 RepID=A0A1M4WVQ8_9CLOT|nr:ABC transporter substrate-binding protein [Clostridium fallax]SHE85324.1 peptide/nickel transport system substrate-binding protein [Clostridium fallax]SQB07433.1 oligopeptide/dipeptide ABC transporter oligopeptide/dipeptide-binding protein [Clostridium fallax]
MKRKSIALLCLLMSASFALAGCGGGSDNVSSNQESGNKESTEKEILKAKDPSKIPEVSKKRKDTLIVGTQNPAGQFCPIYSSTTYDSTVNSLIFEGLLSNDEKGNATANMADLPEISDDGKTYTFKIKDGIKFSDGSDLTADDVAFTYTAICDPKYDGPRTDAVEGLVGYEEYRNGDAKSVSGIKVIDPHTISFTLKKVNASQLYNFGYGIMPKSVYNFEKGNIQVLKDKFLQPVGSGPYKFVKFEQGQYISFEKNDGYWQGEPKIPNIIMKVTNAKTNIQELEAGNVDIDDVAAKKQNIQMLQSAGFLDLQLYPQSAYGYIGLNLRNPKFQDKKVRKALMYGLDRKGFIDNYYQGYGAVQNTHGAVVSWAYPSEDSLEKYEYNPDKANELLDEAGWKMNKQTGLREKDGVPFEISWLTYTDSNYVDSLIPIVKDCWGKLGIKVTPELMEFATLSEKVNDKRDFEIYNMAWNLSIDPDPSAIFSKSQDVPGGFNAVGWHPEESDKLMEEGIATTDQEKRKEIYGKWMQLINDDLPYIFLNNNKKCTVISSKVKNINPSAYVSWTDNIYKAEISTN